ncbi:MULTISPECIES: LysR family transcriptional regulator [unclassified Duganella]|uniref:LysR substrate-binding domain-containing protein n=1 Tax=unclassified Duganella TaxID=2636909 RepID=UPI0008810915|nr:MULTISPECIES: LysR family transcriptional regulator [unclassified Duganella]SDG67971.1 DNA-binding transcriptional regulator, LysR family [Duganella sp. OV458]SDJ93235.1 transcriptional regulator, LysR family [Duganella sp. OV510]
MDRFDTLLAFVRVVEAGSFTKAAQTLHMSKTTVSQLVQQLEARLQVKLLNRTTRQVNVTPEGAAYYERVARLLGDLQDADDVLAGDLAAPRGRLRIDVPSPFARLILMPALPDFHRRYPEIQVVMGVSDRNVDVIGENVDCVIRGGDITVPSLVARRVADLQLGVYASPAYLSETGTPAHPGELDEEPHRMVGYLRSSSGTIAEARLRLGDEEVVVKGRYVVAADDGNAYVAAGVAGMGVLCVPRYMAQPHVKKGELTPLFEEWQLAPMPLYLAYPHNRHVSARLRVFMQWIDELASQSL